MYDMCNISIRECITYCSTVCDVFFVGDNQCRAIARFSYHPELEDELELAVGDEVLVLEVIEEGWWKGRIGQKEGVFPINFVEEITEDVPEPSSSSSHNDKPAPAPQSEVVDHTHAPSMFHDSNCFMHKHIV